MIPLLTKFKERFGGEPRVFSAPGRVNLIGEHTDYNDGFVLPMAIDRRTYVAAAPHADNLVRCVSEEFDGQVEFELSADLQPADDWANHVRGLAACLLRDKFTLRGADLMIASEVPLGSGLSSSAALEISIGFALLKISDQPVDLVDLALAAQRAEHEFAGTRSGIMDQYIACLGIAGHALMIDCRTLEYEAVPVDLAVDRNAVRVVVCNSMVKHDLAAGEYNKRRAECEEAVRRLATHLPGIQALRDVELDEFDLWADSLPDVVRRRANHIITENARTLAAVEALKKGDLVHFGKLMYASHASLRHDYEVSCRELDLLVEIARQCEGVYGARMTGGGFGGCTVNLVAANRVELFIAAITETYRREAGMTPECYVCQASGGVREEHDEQEYSNQVPD
ncbi:MAG: galactokinase [Acidobacteriota bacterium]